MDEQIAERLQKLRKEHGYSQEQLADELGVSRQAVSKWERGEASPDTDNLIALARLYKISVDGLLFNNCTEEVKEEVKEEVTESAPEENNKPHRGCHVGITGLVAGLTVVLSLIAYLLMGCIWGLWHPGWIVFFAIPVFPTVPAAIIEKNPNAFCFPVLVTAVYLLVGFVWGLWHPLWVLFLTIPAYAVIADFIKKK